ncbi:MAG TPA: PIN domain-containing protein [Phycisphaerae bacterium]|jgi:predicted nucleic acid-binding protein|nr:PIN domain-containing protein [Phycisphaerae bacterium]
MKSWFADAFYWIALLNVDDELHRAAVSLRDQLKGNFITTQWILAEVLDGCSTHGNRIAAAGFVRAILEQANVLTVPASEHWFLRGLALYEQRRDKEWSLTDCISFQVMRDYDLTEALTADHHFEQAGFVALLKESES